MQAPTLNIDELVREAENAARTEGHRYFTEVMGGLDGDCCGFCWVEVSGARGKIAAALQENGFYKSTSFNGRAVLCYHFRHGQKTQGLSCLEVANTAAAKVLAEAGLTVGTRSMMD